MFDKVENGKDRNLIAFLGGIFLTGLITVGIIFLVAGAVIAEEVDATTTPAPAAEEVEVVDPEATSDEDCGWFGCIGDKITKALDNNDKVDEAEAQVEASKAELESIKKLHESEIQRLKEGHEQRVLSDMKLHEEEMATLEARAKSAKFQYQQSVESVGRFCENFSKSIAK